MPKKEFMHQLISEKEFPGEVLNSEGLVLVQFRTEWNGACQILAPIYESLSKAYGHKARFLSVDAEEDQDLADQFRINECPTILFFQGGVLVDHAVGLVSRNILTGKIEQWLGGRPG